MSERDKAGRFLKGHHIRKPNATTKAKKIAQAAAEGEELGRLKAHKKKPLEESVKEHIGKVIDGIDLDVVDTGICAGLAYLGYEKFNDWHWALMGPISYKLATSDNEAAGIAGLIGLSTLGLAVALPKEAWELLTAAKAALDASLAGEMKEPTYDSATDTYSCTAGYSLMRHGPVSTDPASYPQLACVANWYVGMAQILGWTVGGPRPTFRASTGGGGTQMQNGAEPSWEAIGRFIPK